MNKTNEIKKIVKEICEKDGFMQWEMHILPVLDNAMRLAKMLNADKDVVEISVYLHDIARIKGEPNDHHIEGTKMAEEILRKLEYPKPFIEKVCYCIQNHGSAFKECKTLESKILNSADAMAHIDNPLWLIWVITKDGKGFKEAFDWVDRKIDKGWNRKIQFPEAREIAKPKYQAAKLLLDSSRGYLYGRKN